MERCCARPGCTRPRWERRALCKHHLQRCRRCGRSCHPSLHALRVRRQVLCWRCKLRDQRCRPYARWRHTAHQRMLQRRRRTTDPTFGRRLADGVEFLRPVQDDDDGEPLYPMPIA